MNDSNDTGSAVRFCPYCGQPLGSFFGVRIEGGATWCERCQECFRVERVEENEEEIRVPGR